MLGNLLSIYAGSTVGIGIIWLIYAQLRDVSGFVYYNKRERLWLTGLGLFVTFTPGLNTIFLVCVIATYLKYRFF